MTIKPEHLKIRLRIIIVLAMLVPLGFGCKFYSGMGAEWVNNSLTGILYVIFWCLVCQSISLKANPFSISAGVFIGASVIELFQLWHIPFLQAIRSTFIGGTLLGNTFIWSDFAYYFFGSICGWLLCRKLDGR